MLCVVVKIHDDQSEGLGRRAIISMVIAASGGTLSRDQASRTWDKTIYPYGKRLGLLTGYVLPQEGSSKRTAAGSVQLQREWHAVCDEMFKKIHDQAMKVLGSEALVEKIISSLNTNLDEENVRATGKNSKVAGSADKKKHDNQNASSRHCLLAFMVI